MTVEQKIKKIVDSMEGVSYLFDNWQTANIRLDKIWIWKYRLGEVMIYIKKGKEPASLTKYKKQKFAYYDGYKEKDDLRKMLLKEQR